MSLQVIRKIQHLHEARMTCMAYDPKLKMLFTGAEDCEIRAWSLDRDEGTELGPPRKLLGHKGALTSLCLIQDIKVLVSASIDGTLIVWAVGSVPNPGSHVPPTLLQVIFHTRTGPIHCLAFNKHRRRLVAGGQGVVFVYAVKENVPKETSLDEKKHRELNQQMLAKNYRPTDGDGDGVKLVPNMRAQVLKRVNEIPFGSDFVRTVTVNSAGRTYVAGYERDVMFWDSDDGSQAQMFIKSVQSHTAAIVAMDVDENTSSVITGSLDGSVKTWSYDGRLLDSFDGVAERVQSLVYIPHIRSLWCSGPNNTIHSLDLMARSNNTECLDILCELTACKMTQLHRPPDSDHVFAITRDRELWVWKLNLFRPLRAFPTPAVKVECLAVVDTSGKGAGMETVVTGTSDGFLLFWNQDYEKSAGVLSVTNDLKGHRGAVLCVTSVQDLGCFVTGGDDGVICVWSVQDGTEDLMADGNALRPLQNTTCEAMRGHEGRVTGVLYLGGHRLASCSHDASIRVWDLDHLTSAHVIEEAHDSPIAMLCEAGERNEFASLAFELAAKVWCATTYQLLYRLEGGHTAEMMCCLWRPLLPRHPRQWTPFVRNVRRYRDMHEERSSEEGGVRSKTALKRDLRQMEKRLEGGVAKVVQGVIAKMRADRKKAKELDDRINQLRRIGNGESTKSGRLVPQTSPRRDSKPLPKTSMQRGPVGIRMDGPREKPLAPIIAGNEGVGAEGGVGVGARLGPSPVMAAKSTGDGDGGHVRFDPNASASAGAGAGGGERQKHGGGVGLGDGSFARTLSLADPWDGMGGSGGLPELPMLQGARYDEDGNEVKVVAKKVDEKADMLEQVLHQSEGLLKGTESGSKGPSPEPTGLVDPLAGVSAPVAAMLESEEVSEGEWGEGAESDPEGPEADDARGRGWGEWITAGEDEALVAWYFENETSKPVPRLSISFSGQSVTSMLLDWQTVRTREGVERQAFLVAAMADKQLRVFHASTFEILARLQGHRDRISGVQKLSDSNHYVSAGYDGGLLVWLSAGQLMARGRDMGGRGGGGGGGGGRSPRKTTSGVGAEGDGDGAGAADGDGVYSLVGLYERRNPLKVPRALRETRESRGLRAGHVSRAVMTRREGPAVEADETYRNSGLAIQLAYAEKNMEKGLFGGEVSGPTTAPADKGDAATSVPAARMLTAALVPRGGLLYKWQETRKRREERHAKEMAKAAVKNNFKG